MYSIEGLTQEEKNLFLQRIGMALVSLALFWKIPSLPDDCKVRIVFVEKTQFEQELVLRGLERHISDLAITTDKIFIKKHTDWDTICSQKEYQQLVLHECVHMLQMYASTTLPENHIWLYESIACYMAGQRGNCPAYSTLMPQWSKFCSSFYVCPNAYYWAYKVGAYIFDNYNQEQILQICCDSELASQIGEQSWTFITNELRLR